MSVRIIKLSALSNPLQAQIKQELISTAQVYGSGNLPIVSSKDVKALVRDYLLTTNLSLSTEEEMGIARGEYSGIFVKSSPGRRYEVLLVKSKQLPRVKKAITQYLQAEKDKEAFEDKDQYKEHLTSIATNIPLKGRILCTRQGVNFLARSYRPISTNLGRR
jgi:hypothetical protein